MNESLWSLVRDTRMALKEGLHGIERRQRARLAEIVAYAREHSPYYRQHYGQLPADINDAAQLPVTSKKELMARFDEWVTDPAITIAQTRALVDDPTRIGERFLGEYTVATTSGTTGTRGIFVMDDRSMRITNAIAFRMLTSWLGLKDVLRIIAHRGRVAMIMATGGHFASTVAATRLQKKRAKRIGVFPAHTPLPTLVKQLNEFQPTLVAPYASVASLLATEQEAGRLKIHPVLLTLAAEGLPPNEYRRIANAFKATVGNSYAATECPFLSYGCDQGWLHINADWVIVEPVDADHQPVSPGTQSHTVLITNLANRVQPILRYDLGDSVLQQARPCACGNPLPAIRVQGRTADVLTFERPDGTSVQIPPLALGGAIEHVRGIAISQIEQTAPSTLRVRLQLNQDADAKAIWRAVSDELTRLLGDYDLSHVKVERDEARPQQSAGGKIRQVIPLARHA